MKQEVIIAIIGGFLIGAVAAFGVVQLSSRMKSSSPTIGMSEPTPSPASSEPTTAPTEVSSGGLEISEPKDDTVTETKSTKLSGKTKPGNIIVIVTDAETTAEKASSEGTFTATIPLQEGSNVISVYSYDEKGAEQTKTVSVFYTSQAL